MFKYNSLIHIFLSICEDNLVNVKFQHSWEAIEHFPFTNSSMQCICSPFWITSNEQNTVWSNRKCYWPLSHMWPLKVVPVKFEKSVPPTSFHDQSKTDGGNGCGLSWIKHFLIDMQICKQLCNEPNLNFFTFQVH